MATETAGTVLLIEDDQANIEMLQYLLADSGLEIVAATSGERGIELAEEAQPDVILLDLPPGCKE